MVHDGSDTGSALERATSWCIIAAMADGAHVKTVKPTGATYDPAGWNAHPEGDKEGWRERLLRAVPMMIILLGHRLIPEAWTPVIMNVVGIGGSAACAGLLVRPMASRRRAARRAVAEDPRVTRWRRVAGACRCVALVAGMVALMIVAPVLRPALGGDAAWPWMVVAGVGAFLGIFGALLADTHIPEVGLPSGPWPHYELRRREDWIQDPGPEWSTYLKGEQAVQVATTGEWVERPFGGEHAAAQAARA